MTCILRNPNKYIGPDGQPLLSANERRPLTMARISDYTQQECFELMQSKGRDFRMPSKPKKVSNQQYYKYLQSKTRVVPGKEMERIKNASKYMTVDERLEALAREEDLARRKNEQTANAKMYFKKIDDAKLKAIAEKAGAVEDDEDLFGKAAKQKLMDRAFLAKQEQEEEVKQVNRFILHSQCQALRDVQIKEKRDYERKQTEERIRLERMVIEENAKSLAKEDEHAVKKKERDAKYAEEIRQQLLQRQTLRIMEAERIEEEGRIYREANAALQREEEKLAQIARKRRALFRADLDRLVEMSNLFKKMLQEQECEADRRVAQYNKEKLERELQLKKEKQTAAENMERKRQMLYEMSKKLAASKDEREQMNIMREKERAEREYRRKEKEAALAKQQLEDDIRETRLMQLEQCKQRQALQIAREEKEFNEMIKTMKAAEEQEKKKEEEREKRRQKYYLDITGQMKHKAEMHRALLESIRQESVIWREAERQRLANIRAVIGAKLAAMRDACLPESYIKDIERLLDRIMKRSPTEKK